MQVNKQSGVKLHKCTDKTGKKLLKRIYCKTVSVEVRRTEGQRDRRRDREIKRDADK